MKRYNVAVILLTSIGRLSFPIVPLTFKTFSADNAEIMPNEPSNIPASTTVSYHKEGVSTINIDELCLPCSMFSACVHVFLYMYAD